TAALDIRPFFDRTVKRLITRTWRMTDGSTSLWTHPSQPWRDHRRHDRRRDAGDGAMGGWSRLGFGLGRRFDLREASPGCDRPPGCDRRAHQTGAARPRVFCQYPAAEPAAARLSVGQP